MKTRTEIEDKMKFLEGLLDVSNEIDVVLGSRTKAKIRGQINLLKWVLDIDSKKEK